MVAVLATIVLSGAPIVATALRIISIWPLMSVQKDTDATIQALFESAAINSAASTAS